MRDNKSNGRSRFAERWQPAGDYRAECESCDWLRIEQFKKPVARIAREHVEETGHVVSITVQSYTRVLPELEMA